MAFLQVDDQDYQELITLKETLSERLAQAATTYMANVYNRLHKYVVREYVRATRAREQQLRMLANQRLAELRGKKQERGEN